MEDIEFSTRTRTRARSRGHLGAIGVCRLHHVCFGVTESTSGGVTITVHYVNSEAARARRKALVELLLDLVLERRS
jgi:hypothetical protein